MSINPQAQGAEGGSMSLSLAWQHNKILAQKKQASSKQTYGTKQQNCNFQ